MDPDPVNIIPDPIPWLCYSFSPTTGASSVVSDTAHPPSEEQKNWSTLYNTQGGDRKWCENNTFLETPRSQEILCQTWYFCLHFLYINLQEKYWMLCKAKSLYISALKIPESLFAFGQVCVCLGHLSRQLYRMHYFSITCKGAYKPQTFTECTNNVRPQNEIIVNMYIREREREKEG